MQKNEFLAKLRILLHALPEEDLKRVIRDYEAYFDLKIKQGFSEEEIVESLGSPEDIAREVLEGPRRREQTSKAQSFIIALALVFFNLIFVLGPILGALGFVFALVVTSISFILSPLGIILKLILDKGHLFEFFLSLVLAAFGILLLPLIVRLVKFMDRIFRKYAEWNLKMIRGEY